MISNNTVLGIERFSRFSVWKRLLLAISLLMHLVQNFKSKQKDDTLCHGWHMCEQHKTVQSCDAVRNFIIRQYQQQAFIDEIQCLKASKPLPLGSSILKLSYLDEDAYGSPWKSDQYLSESFWNRWRREYIHSFQSCQKWHAEKTNLREGDVVLMQDENLNRTEWPLGRVTRAFPSEDGLVRKVEIHVPRRGGSAKHVRPITGLVKLIGAE